MAPTGSLLCLSEVVLRRRLLDSKRENLIIGVITWWLCCHSVSKTIYLLMKRNYLS
ncbi:hypothetical protein SLEP1_g43288 [Rubroshorea leprosula]|uniref:Uncharacterized protein n=1 Tax=Rubroshorea leprosula TaxID=152421 RepID=A0AAV5LCH9_9ROSI|nr:hypothetical protein SLEP1_g43288 [Rubroshorea leprosula]